MQRPSEHDLRVMCLMMAHEAEESIAQTMKRATLYFDFIRAPQAEQQPDSNILPFNHAARPL